MTEQLLEGFPDVSLNVGPKYKLVNSLMLAMPLKFGNFPRECCALCAVHSVLEDDVI